MKLTRQWDVSLRGTMFSVWPRRMWQEIFNVYMEFEGILNHMDNMLIDFTCITKFFEGFSEPFRSRFAWGFDEGGCRTHFRDSSQLVEDNESNAIYLACGVCVIAEVVVNDGCECVKFELWEMDLSEEA